MKKLFFAAALAIVAVGGALSSQATTYWTVAGAGQTSFNCITTGDNLCSEIAPTIYELQNVPQGPAVTKSSLTTRYTQP